MDYLYHSTAISKPSQLTSFYM